MGSGSIKFEGLSVAPRWGMGFLTDGRLFKFDSPYPLKEFQLLGGEIALDFRRGESSKKVGNSTSAGQLGFIFLRGTSTDNFSEADLPLPEEGLGSLIKFNVGRRALSYLSMLEYRWPLMASVWAPDRWSFVKPMFTLGAGANYIKTKISEDGAKPTIETSLDFFLTASTSVSAVRVRFGRIDLSLDFSVRLLAGQVFGFIGEGLFRVTYRYPD